MVSAPPPTLVGDLTYTQVAAGMLHTVLLRSDGTAVACGRHEDGQTDLPELDEDLAYIAHMLPALLLQVSFDGDVVRFVTFGGAERCSTKAVPTARLADIYGKLTADHRAGRLGLGAWLVDAILPGGRLLSRASAEETVGSVFGPVRAL